MPGVEFHPIQLDSLVTDTVLDFELHSKAANDAFVLFRGRDQEFASRHRDGLLSHGIHTLYVSEEDQRSYGRYVEQNISRLAADPTVSLLKRRNCFTQSRRVCCWTLSPTRDRPTW